MREIKFRAKSVCDKGEFVYGDLIHKKNGDVMIDDGQIGTDVDMNTVGQFTGVIDTDGREIYEGDIIKSYDSWCIHVINYNDRYAQFKATEPSEYGADCTLNQDWVSRHHKFVVGNIYDNPNMVAEKKGIKE